MNLRNLWGFIWEIVSDGFLRWCLILDGVLYLADYFAVSFKPSPRVFELIFLVGVLGAAYRRDQRQRETIAELRGRAERVEDMPVRDKSKIERAVEEAGYEVKYPHPANVLELLRTRLGVSYRSRQREAVPNHLGDGPGGSPMMKRRRPA